MVRQLALTTLLTLAFAVTGGASAQSQADQIALNQLQSFLFDDVARRAYASKNREAHAANQYMEQFPPWAQQELLSIVMDIMRQDKGKALRHEQNYQKGGVAGFRGGMTPAIQRRIDNLVQRLQQDRSFNNEPNLKRMQRQVPRDYRRAH